MHARLLFSARCAKCNQTANSTKRLDYFRFSGNPLQRFELREAKVEKRENLHFFRPRLDYKLSENK